MCANIGRLIASKILHVVRMPAGGRAFNAEMWLDLCDYGISAGFGYWMILNHS